MPRASSVILAMGLLLVSSLGQDPRAEVEDPRPLDALFPAQEPPKVVPRLLEGADPSATSIRISLGKQRAYLSVGDEVAIDTPVCTGKPRAMTPKGQFAVLEKKAACSSPFFGEYVDSEGRGVRFSVSARTDVAPAGTTFRAVPVQYYIRLDENGLALHAGPLPGYPASDTSVRLPADIAPLFFQRVKEGTPVSIGD
ncbi:MAG: L,D-transpeptidase [Chthoniobacterales bacterium]